MFWLAIILTLTSGLLSLAGAALLALKKNWPHAFALQLTAFSSGVLLATSLLHLAPEAIEEISNPTTAFKSILLSIIIFFILERLVLWYHHHHESHGPRPASVLVIVGDSLHNFLDGVLIAGATMVDSQLGILTAIAVATHELPQEIADFSILVASGMSRKKALFFNAVSALTAVLGAASVFALGSIVESHLPIIIAFSAGTFLYIALSDLIPELHHHTKDSVQKWVQLILLILGVLAVVGLEKVLPH